MPIEQPCSPRAVPNKEIKLASSCAEVLYYMILTLISRCGREYSQLLAVLLMSGVKVDIRHFFNFTIKGGLFFNSRAAD